MLIIKNKLRNFLVIVNSVLQENTRGYATIKKIPVRWIRPKPVLCYSKERSGDKGIEFDIKPEDPILKYENVKSLDDADEITKKMVSVEFNSGQEYLKLKIKKAIDMSKRHKFDTHSMEAQFGRLTVRILHLQELLKREPTNVRAKTVCKEAIDKRYKYLKKLRERDYACFEYIIDKFNIIYHSDVRPEHYQPVYRKLSTKRLLQSYCDKLVQKKLDDYKQKLENQQKDFFKEKAEMLEFIRKEEIECGVEPTVTEEEIEAAKQKALSFA